MKLYKMSVFLSGTFQICTPNSFESQTLVHFQKAMYELTSLPYLQVACCEAYTSEDIRPHIPTLWASIRREVIEANSAEGEAAALSALTAIILTLERGMVTHAGRDAMNMLIKSAMMGKLSWYSGFFGLVLLF